MKMIDTEKFYTTLSQGKRDGVEKLVREALKMGESAEIILKKGFISAMDRVGGQIQKR